MQAGRKALFLWLIAGELAFSWWSFVGRLWSDQGKHDIAKGLD